MDTTQQPTPEQLQGAVMPTGFDRRHHVSEAQEKAAEGQTPPPLRGASSLTPNFFRRKFLSRWSLWVPTVTQRYAGLLDHGYRQATNGIVIHVNAGYFKGTLGFVTNGLSYPYGSQGVGAHFEIGGQPGSSIYADGPTSQLLPLDRFAWHAVAANATTIGMEHSGFGNSVDEWEKTHYNTIGNSAYIAAWILRRFNLGPPRISLTNPSVGNVWPHSAGGWNWGGHACPGAAFPWALWEKYCLKAYNQKWHVNG